MTATRTRPRPSPGRAGGRSTPRAARRRAIPFPLLGGAVILLLLGLAFALSGGGADDAAISQTAPVEIVGDALPPLVTGQADAAVGMQAPVLHGVGFDGAPVSIAPSGPTMVIFAAHWCQYCQNEVAELSPWLAEGASAELGVSTVAVSTAVDRNAPNYPPSAWFEREGWPNRVLLDSDAREAADAFGLSGYPFFVFIDADGQVAGRSSGAMGVEAIEAILGRLAP